MRCGLAGARTLALAPVLEGDASEQDSLCSHDYKGDVSGQECTEIEESICEKETLSCGLWGRDTTYCFS